MKQFCRLLLLCVLTFSLASEPFAAAVSITPTPPATTSTPPLVITSLAGNGVFAGNSVIELFNQTDKPINVTNWRVDFSITDTCSNFTVSAPLGSGWLLAGNSLTLSVSNLRAGCSTAWLSSVAIFNGADVNQRVVIPDALSLPYDKVTQHRQRSNSSSTRTITNNFTDDYTKKIEVKDAKLFNDPLYLPPSSNGGLQILEMLPHARDCSPSDTTSPDCADYVKLYNPTNAPIDLSLYRLRIGYKGQSVGVANTFHFGQRLDPGKYFTLAARDDGQALSITDTGNYVWLEDAYGTVTYDPVVQYPSASSTSKVGWAWAFDGQNWRWTSAPHPFDANYFPPEIPAKVPASSTTTLKPCAANQYRNPLTNRCKSIVSASTLVPCKPNQIRNPETNRCRSALAVSSSLQPCKAGQVRNPETNRCKSASSTSSQLKPCQPGWERNPETNRCRKGSVLGSATTKVQDIAAPAKSGIRWLLIGGVGAGALAYALYEWRQEIRLKLAVSKQYISSITKLKK